ncbi:hypothetical protein CRE_23034 [Caenorhabditis remanei]|uniref:WD repeat domain phosphoinositide-interacting protein 2 n=1 Tax=Caenorhabditis remanei TaxID=31234 RepID=E3N4G9_CAERE|nr:hypothetical protein CRE_23034 [Caenorhabditis remanei]
MSTPRTAETPESINCIGFNQDYRLLSIGHKKGYMFYKTADILESSTLPNRILSTNSSGFNNCTIVERLFSSSLMVVVSENEFRVLHLTSNNVISSHRFNKSILTVRINRQRIITCFEDCIQIYNLSDMKLIHTIIDTPMNKLGIVDLTSNTGNAFIAYPGSTDTGAVYIFDAINLKSVNTFVAHEGTLACLQFNQEGNMIATASTKGTVIRVYSVPDGNRLYEFRRGVSRYVTIQSLCFSSDSKFLAACSNVETIHVFKLEKAEEKIQPEATNESSGWFDTFNKTITAYMPTQFMQVTEMITTERSFATARLPVACKSNRIALVAHKNQQYLMAATSDGYVYAYQMNPEGGELDLIKQPCFEPETVSGGSSCLLTVGNQGG